MEDYPLTKEQQHAFDQITHTFNNYFITGKPGTGKSVLINALIDSVRKHFTVCAPTGLAALNIKTGKTLNSTFRIPIFEGILEPDYNEFPSDDRTVNFIKYNVKHLIVDEVSMVRCDTLDYIDRLLQHVKGRKEPFGGVQVILVGDYYQLPPVARNSDKIALFENGYESQFSFDAKSFKDGNFIPLQLTKVLRQKDAKFIKVLHAARSGDITPAQCGILNANVGVMDDLRPVVCGVNKQADAINFGRLRGIEGEPTKYTAKQFGYWPAVPVDKELDLKVGAQVMVKMNGADQDPNDREEDFVSNVVNGSLAVVEELHKDGTVTIKLENGVTTKIYRQRWELKVKNKNADGVWEEKVEAYYEQMPLALAWAISIHKSQGQSFDKIMVDPSRVFEDGQLYVAVSRARSLKGLKFSSPVNTKKFKVNEHVKRFYEQLK